LKIVFDLATPKQVRFFKPMIDRLREGGYAVSVVTRDAAELNLIIRRFGIEATVLGQFGGKSLLGKLVKSTERVRLLARHFDHLCPDALVTLCNPESARAAYGLRIPIVCFLDLPESTAVARLTLPLASRVCVPWIIPRREFVKCGVSPETLFRYRALDPLIWLKDHRVNGSYLDTLRIDPRRPVIVCRETEWQSVYATEDIVGRVTQALSRKHQDWQLIEIPRYKPHRFYETPSLLANAHLFIGGGGTMCIEAAYYGTPVLATRPLTSYYMTWLFERGLALESLALDETVRKAEEIIESRTAHTIRRQRERAAAIFRRMTFPLERVVEVILDAASGSRPALNSAPS
jgi:predicted glycosyltransferase